MATVYVVDDEPVFGEAVAALLADLGHDARGFADPAAALAAAGADPPDLLLVDLAMPGMDGPTLLAALRERGVLAPAVLVTGVRRARRGGAAAVLAKPFDAAALAAAVRHALGE